MDRMGHDCGAVDVLNQLVVSQFEFPVVIPVRVEIQTETLP